MNTQTHTENVHGAVDRLAEKARFWEQKARDAEEGYNTLLQDHTVLKAEFDDITANAEWLASIIRSHLAHLPEAREALDASPGTSAAKPNSEPTATLEKVCEIFGIGERARTPSTILTNVENAARFANYLHAIERAFLMVPGKPDEEFPDEEPENECLVNSWGARSRENYVEQFSQALAQLKFEWQADMTAGMIRLSKTAGTDEPWTVEELELKEQELRRQAQGGE